MILSAGKLSSVRLGGGEGDDGDRCDDYIVVMRLFTVTGVNMCIFSEG